MHLHVLLQLIDEEYGVAFVSESLVVVLEDTGASRQHAVLIFESKNADLR